MNDKANGIIISLLTFLCIVTSIQTAGVYKAYSQISSGSGASTVSARQEWEYDVIAIDDLKWDTDGKLMGLQGWEVVSARRASDGAGTMSYEMLIKRPKLVLDGEE